jgi:hypothetical protein
VQARQGSLGRRKTRRRAVAGARPLQRAWYVQMTACVTKRLCVRLPAFLVKVDRQYKAGFVLKHWIDAHDENFAFIIFTREVPSDCLVRDRNKTLMRAIGAFDPGFFAHALDPFIGAYRLIACLARLSALKAAWVNVFAPAKEGAEKSDFRFRRRPMVDSSIMRRLDHQLFEGHGPAHHPSEHGHEDRSLLVACALFVRGPRNMHQGRDVGNKTLPT